MCVCLEFVSQYFIACMSSWKAKFTIKVSKSSKTVPKVKFFLNFLFNGISILLNAEGIPIEEQQWYYVIHSGGGSGWHICFPRVLVRKWTYLRHWSLNLLTTMSPSSTLAATPQRPPPHIKGKKKFLRKCLYKNLNKRKWPLIKTIYIIQ